MGDSCMNGAFCARGTNTINAFLDQLFSRVNPIIKTPADAADSHSGASNLEVQTFWLFCVIGAWGIVLEHARNSSCPSILAAFVGA